MPGYCFSTKPLARAFSPVGHTATALPQSAMIVSPSLPPVPAKAVEKIVKHQFVEMKELMPDNFALMLLLAELGPNQPVSSGKLREIDNPLTWVFYFLSFLAVSVSARRARELAAYGPVIVHLAQRHGAKDDKRMITYFVSRLLLVPVTLGQSSAPL